MMVKQLISSIIEIITISNAYNEYQKKGYNMNKIKAILHNKVLYSLTHKDNYPYDKIVVDQFVYPRKYFEHIMEATEKVTNITFTTKAESKCASVAAASIISRYIFLKENPFYAESGGQIYDTGYIKNDDCKIEVLDVVKAPNKQHLLHVKVLSGTLTNNTLVLTHVLGERREEITKNHSSLHLLQKTLQEILEEYLQDYYH